jgi:hypothetical protein
MMNLIEVLGLPLCLKYRTNNFRISLGLPLCLYSTVNFVRIFGIPLTLYSREIIGPYSAEDFLRRALLTLSIQEYKYLGNYFFNFRGLVIARFIRDVIDDNFSFSLPSKPEDPEVFEIINRTVTLWVKLWACLKELYPYPKHKPDEPALLFLEIVVERQLVLLGFENIKELGGLGNLPSAKEVCRGRQTQTKRVRILEKAKEKGLVPKKKEPTLPGYVQQNKKLRNLENPFTRRFRKTWQFIQEAQKKAQRDNNFNQNYYQPMIKARTAVTSLIENSGEVNTPAENQKNRRS